MLQTKNNYDLGVFNGFTGVVISIEDEVVVVDFDGQGHLRRESTSID